MNAPSFAWRNASYFPLCPRSALTIHAKTTAQPRKIRTQESRVMRTVGRRRGRFVQGFREKATSRSVGRAWRGENTCRIAKTERKRGRTAVPFANVRNWDYLIASSSRPRSGDDRDVPNGLQHSCGRRAAALPSAPATTRNPGHGSSSDRAPRSPGEKEPRRSLH